MSDDLAVLTKEQFEQEWSDRALVAAPPVAQPRVRVRLPQAQVEEHGVLRPLLGALLESLLDFDDAVAPPPSKRRIRRK